MEKVLLVTGASSGIGAAVAEVAAVSCHSVCINYRNNTQKAEKLKESISIYNSRVIAVKANISTKYGMLHLFKEIDPKLDTTTHLVNNAGVIAQLNVLKELH